MPDRLTPEQQAIVERMRAVDEDLAMPPSLPRPPAGPLLHFAARVLVSAVAATAVVAFLLDIISVLVGGIWLAVSGHWGILIGGMLAGVVMPWGFALASLPALAIGALAALLSGTRLRAAAALPGFLCSLYNNALIAIWVVGVLFFLAVDAGAPTVPGVLWAYAVAMGPLQYMASKEPPDSHGTTMGLLYANLTYFAYAPLCVLGPISPIPFYIVAGVGVALSLLAAAMVLSEGPS